MIEDEEELEEPQRPPTRRERLVALLKSLARWAITLVVAFLIIAIGENIDALHRLDAAIAPHRTAVLTVLGGLAAAGFALFMGGILALLLRGPSSETERGIELVHARRAGVEEPVNVDGEITLTEVIAATRDGTWRDRPRIKRFYVIGGGVALMLAAGIAGGVAVAPPGIKLLLILAGAYAGIRAIVALVPRR